jgi:hypothetical protein
VDKDEVKMVGMTALLGKNFNTELHGDTMDREILMTN